MIIHVTLFARLWVRQQVLDTITQAHNAETLLHAAYVTSLVAYQAAILQAMSMFVEPLY